ncbi:HU family DNA-binding protein [Priestia aryabhattai]
MFLNPKKSQNLATCIPEDFLLAKEEKIQLVGFGIFEIRDGAERSGRNLQTGEEMTIMASKALAFKPEKELKEAIK